LKFSSALSEFFFAIFFKNFLKILLDRGGGQKCYNKNVFVLYVVINSCSADFFAENFFEGDFMRCKILKFPVKNFNDNKIILKRGNKMIDNAELLKNFLENCSCIKNENNCVIKICPEEIEEKCGVEVRNFIMKNLIFDKGNEDYKGKFFGCNVKTEPHYKYETYKYDYVGIDYQNISSDYIVLDYYDLTLSRQDYEKLQKI